MSAGHASESDPVASSSSHSDETVPLLPSNIRVKKPWYRPRPLWLVPFAVAASISRGMTLAPRVEVFTELACEKLRPIYFNHTSLLHLSTPHPSIVSSEAHFPIPVIDIGDSDDDEDLPPITDLPSEKCIKDPQVQAAASKLQTMMITILGLLSALTTGAWGRFGERHGRTKVMALSVAGLLFTDLMFLCAASKAIHLGGHRYLLLLLAPIVDGLLGSYSTLQATTTAYISDCTSDGSRSHIFSRFHGTFFIGIALGPEVGALLIRHFGNTTWAFVGASCLSALNLFLCVFVFPESLTPSKKEALAKKRATRVIAVVENQVAFPLSLFSPLKVFLPRKREHRKGLDWNFTLLAVAMFSFMLTIGMYQTKYLYAKSTYSWGAEQLSYYITFLGSSRAVHLLLLLPYVTRNFKPLRVKGRNEAPTPKVLTKEMRFDLWVAKLSLIMDVMSHSLVALLDSSYEKLFIVASSFTALGGGAHPAMQSLALCLSQIHGDHHGAGELLGAISFLQAIGSLILGPLLFGLSFSATVAIYPKAIFVMAATLLTISIASLSFIRPSRRLDAILQEQDEQNRGRPRASKALRVIVESDITNSEPI